MMSTLPLLRFSAYIVVLASSFASFGATAQPPARPLTLGEAIARAQNIAPSLRGAEAGVRAAEAGVHAAGQILNPTVSIEAENVLGTGRYARYGAGEMTYSISMPWELGGKRAARVRLAVADRAHAGVFAAAAKADLTLETTQAFIAVLATARRATAANTALELAERAEAAARERVRAGKVSPIDEQRASVQRINAQIKADRTKRGADIASAALARLLDITNPGPVTADWFDDPDGAAPTDQPAAYLSLASADAQIAAAAARVDVARRARIPDPTVGIGTRRFRETGDSALTVSMSIPLPVFNSGGAELARSRAELEKIQAERQAAQREVEQALANAQAQVADARATAIAAIGPARAAASEAARIARIGYAEGKFSQIDLIEAERSLSETQESAIDALAMLHDARARLARVQGRITPIYKN